MKKILFFNVFLILNLFAEDNCDYNATEIADNLNIAYQDYNYLMALSGLFAGFVFFIVISLLAKDL